MKLLEFRYNNRAFSENSTMEFEIDENKIKIRWNNGEATAELNADLEDYSFEYR